MSLDILNNLITQATSDIAKAEDIYILKSVYVKFLGKQGYITQQIKSINTIPLEKRPMLGAVINQAKKKINKLYFEKKNFLKLKNINNTLAQNNTLDITLPGRISSIGTVHPITHTIERIKKFFHFLGFSTKHGPEIDNDYFNFDALNIPPYHPARNEHDTFWFNKKLLLRTHTSGIQIRVMRNTRNPIRIISFGRVYRKDSDKNHTPMFHQMEGIIIDTTINFSHLKKILCDFLLYFFQENVHLRFRPSYFPFTEPSAEIDIIEKSSGKWIEILGCGMIHPKILCNANIDTKKFSGCAFGIGIERLLMLLYHINDIRIFFENDLNFLNQFKQ